MKMMPQWTRILRITNKILMQMQRSASLRPDGKELYNVRHQSERLLLALAL